MAKSTEYILDGKLMIEVGFAKGFQDSVRNSKVVNFEDKDHELKILKANPNEILVVKSSIDSPKTIKSVEYYDEVLNSI